MVHGLTSPSGYVHALADTKPLANRKLSTNCYWVCHKSLERLSLRTKSQLYSMRGQCRCSLPTLPRLTGCPLSTVHRTISRLWMCSWKARTALCLFVQELQMSLSTFRTRTRCVFLCGRLRLHGDLSLASRDREFQRLRARSYLSTDRRGNSLSFLFSLSRAPKPLQT